MVRLAPRALPSVLLFAATLAACGTPDRNNGGFRVVERRDSGIPRDAATAPDAGSEAPDAGFAGEDAGEGFDVWVGDEDAGVPDTGPQRPDATFPDATFPDASWPDASIPDTGPRRDAGGFDAGNNPWDGGLPIWPDGGVMTDGGVNYQTNVSILSSTAVINLQPPVAADPLTYTVQLQYDNSGPGSETISVVNASVSLIVITQNFQMGPPHTAPVGSSQRTVAKIPGTADTGLSFPDLLCAGLPAIVTIELSNGALLSDLPQITCVN
ncbi:hypothetical protein L6R52_12700 [Myxococcota bacterium]|nr:hypothetical protein [Myxococcota bacterium]